MQKHSVSVAAVVKNSDGEILLIQRNDNKEWQIPGGILELEESLESGVRREVREEAGIEISVGNLSGIYKNCTKGIIAFVFKADYLSGDLKTSEESDAVQWFPFDEAVNLVPDIFKPRITDSNLLEINIRLHNGISYLS